MNNEFDYGQVERLIDDIYRCLPSSVTANENGFLWQILLNFPDLQKYLVSLDSTIQSFNQLEECHTPSAIGKLQFVLERRKLPTIEFLLKNKSSSDVQRFKDTMMNLQKKRGSRIEMYFRNNASEASDLHTHFVWLIFFAYEDYVTTHLELEIPGGLIRSALLERVKAEPWGVLYSHFRAKRVSS